MGGNTNTSEIIMVGLSVAAVVLLIVLIYLYRSDKKDYKSNLEKNATKYSKAQMKKIENAKKAALSSSENIATEIASIDPNQIADEALSEILLKVKGSFQKEVEAKLSTKLSELDRSLSSSLKNTESSVTQLLNNYYTNSKNSLENSLKLVDLETAKADQAIKAIIDNRKADIITKIDNKIISILTSYLNETLVGAIDLSDQEEYIFDRLNANKQAIIEDIKSVSI